MGIHLLCYVHGNEHIEVHDAIHHVFVAIARNVGFHFKKIDLIPQSCATQRFIILNIVQAKERNYCNPHPINQFLPLPIHK
jgi:hypothetical protein